MSVERSSGFAAGAPFVNLALAARKTRVDQSKSKVSREGKRHSLKKSLNISDGTDV
jgi:hypothetical protein